MQEGYSVPGTYKLFPPVPEFAMQATVVMDSQWCLAFRSNGDKVIQVVQYVPDPCLQLGISHHIENLGAERKPNGNIGST